MASLVLVSPATPDSATATNARLLAGFFPPEKTFTLPWLGKKFFVNAVLKRPQVKRMLAALVQV